MYGIVRSMHDHITKNHASAPTWDRGISIDSQNPAHDPVLVTARSLSNVEGAVVRGILPGNSNRSHPSLMLPVFHCAL